MQTGASTTNWVCGQCQKSNVSVLHHCLRCNAARKGPASAQSLPVSNSRRATGTRASPLAPLPTPPTVSATPSATVSNVVTSARGVTNSYYPTSPSSAYDEDLTASGGNLRRGVSAPAAPSTHEHPISPIPPSQVLGGEGCLVMNISSPTESQASHRQLEADRALVAKQRELKAIAEQVNEAASVLAAHQEELARVCLQLDEATLQVQLSKLESARYDLVVAKKKLESAKATLADVNRENEAPLVEMKTKEKLAFEIMAEHKSNEEKIAALTKNYSQEVPALTNMNSKQKQEWNDLGSSVYDMQHVLTTALKACQTPQENELQRLKIELAQRKADLKVAYADKEFARKEQWTARMTLDEEKAKLKKAELDSKDMVRKAELVLHQTEECQKRLEALKARYSEDVSALSTNNTKLKQQWNDIGSALYDMQQTLIDAKL